MFLKKDLNFITKYEKVKNAFIIFIDNQIIIQDMENHMTELHILNEQHRLTVFPLKEFLDAYKQIHGAKHIFEVTEQGISIYIKKTKEVDKTISLSHSKKIQLPSFDNAISIGTIPFKSLKNLELFTKITSKLDYLPFFKNPILIKNEDNLYIWGTDCIHQLKIILEPSQNLNKSTYFSYYIPQKLCKIIGNFCKENKGKANLSINFEGEDDYLIINNESGYIYFRLLEDNDSIPYEHQLSHEYHIDSKEIKEIKSLKLRNLVAKSKKKVKESFEVIIRILEGDIYLNEEKIFSLKSSITLNKPINGYRFIEFLEACDEVYIGESYIRSGETILVL